MNTQILFPHIAINVSSIDASLAFYKALFNAEPVKVRKGYAKFELQHPKLNFSLNEADSYAASAVAEQHINHLGFQVGSTEDVLAIKSRLVAAGLAATDEMNTTCCYAVQDKTWLRDPDGLDWEIFVVLADAASYHGGCNDANACCTPDLRQQQLVSIALPVTIVGV